MHTNISLQQLRYIIEVAECGSINAASQQLYVSQPTLSATIKDTEQELGISIFNRTNRGITLTNEGTEFIGYARQILEQFDFLKPLHQHPLFKQRKTFRLIAALCFLRAGFRRFSGRMPRRRV